MKSSALRVALLDLQDGCVLPVHKKRMRTITAVNAKVRIVICAIGSAAGVAVQLANCDNVSILRQLCGDIRGTRYPI